MNTGMRLKARAGAATLLAGLALGGLALTAPVTADELRADTAVRDLRFGLATTVCKDLTAAAQEKAGLIALALGLAVLLARRRRWDAARLLATAGAAWILALAVKDLIGRPRPPARLWLLPPDGSGSFPSGHAVTAAIIVVILSLALRGAGRTRALIIGLGLAFALAVGASRIYLGDHYPTDILGSYLTVTAAVLLISAAADLPRIRRHAARLLRIPGIAPHPKPIPPARARSGDQAARQPRPAPRRPARPQQPGRPDPSQLTAASQPPAGGTR